MTWQHTRCGVGENIKYLFSWSVCPRDGRFVFILISFLKDFSSCVSFETLSMLLQSKHCSRLTQTPTSEVCICLKWTPRVPNRAHICSSCLCLHIFWLHLAAHKTSYAPCWLLDLTLMEISIRRFVVKHLLVQRVLRMITKTWAIYEGRLTHILPCISFTPNHMASHVPFVQVFINALARRNC